MRPNFSPHFSTFKGIRIAIMLAVCALSVVISPGDSPKAADRTARLQRVEAMVIELPGEPGKSPLPLSLAELMKVYNVPGLSLAVIENYKIVDAKAYGVIEAGSSTPVTTHTLFQAGSISKPVAATGALYLVQQGKLSLDQDVNERLQTWKVPENEFTKTEKVTLRRLMSHTAGLTVHGFPGYDVNDPLPTLVQVLNGEKPANTDPIRVDIVPGTKSRYSGGGVTIEQLLMMDATGKPFPALMRELVLDKIGMTDSSYEQPLPAARAAMTAGGTYIDGKEVHGRWHVYPEMAAAGLWTTPTDLAKFAIEIALSKQGKANHVLSQKSVQEMLTPQIKSEGGQSHIGLAFFLDDKNPGEFGHDGDDEGFEANLIMLGDSGKGLAIMGNSDSFFYVVPYILDAVAHKYDWKYTPAPKAAGHALMLIENVRSPQAALDFYKKLKQSASSEYKIEAGSLNQLGYHLLMQKKTDEAIKVFQLNVEEYPQESNCYDSLGEAYMRAGQKDLAIKNYEKSLELNPDNKNGQEMLKKLKGN